MQSGFVSVVTESNLEYGSNMVAKFAREGVHGEELPLAVAVLPCCKHAGHAFGGEEREDNGEGETYLLSV